MSEADQRKQWSDHMKDEAIALEEQQTSAGDTHSPVQRWDARPGGADAEVSAATAAERQRCAGMADSWADAPRLQRAFPDFSEAELAAAGAALRALAAEIRDAAAS
jgi:hypothetical protein